MIRYRRVVTRVVAEPVEVSSRGGGGLLAGSALAARALHAVA